MLRVSGLPMRSPAQLLGVLVLGSALRQHQALSAWPPKGCVRADFPRSSAVSPTQLAYQPSDDFQLGASAQFPAALGKIVPTWKCGSTTGASHGSVLVLSEWFGVSSATASVARALAANELDAYIVNSYRDHVLPVDAGYVSVEAVQNAQADSGHKMKTLAWAPLAHDVQTVAANLTAIGPVAVMGFSEGAALAMLASQDASPHIKATVAFYGSPGSVYTGTAASLFDPANVNVPVYLVCGALDHIAGFSSCSALKAMQDGMENAPSVTLKEYQGVGHGFMNDQSWWETWKLAQNPPRDPFNVTTATDAFLGAVQFLQRSLTSTCTVVLSRTCSSVRPLHTDNHARRAAADWYLLR